MSEGAEEDYGDRELEVRRTSRGSEADDSPHKVRIQKDNLQQAIGYQNLEGGSSTRQSGADQAAC